jgi:hypothetical protein
LEFKFIINDKITYKNIIFSNNIIMGLGQKLKRRTIKLGKKLDNNVQKLGQKSKNVLDKSSKAISKLDGGLKKADNILTAANNAGLANVPVLGEVSTSAQKLVRTARRGTEKAKNIQNKLEKGQRDLEKFNSRKMLAQASKTDDPNSNFV